jgi:hypothetical protein
MLRRFVPGAIGLVLAGLDYLHTAETETLVPAR